MPRTQIATPDLTALFSGGVALPAFELRENRCETTDMADDRAPYVSGGRGESHPPAPTDPGVRVSPHRALVILIIRNRRTTPTGRTASGTDGLPAASTPWPSGTPAAVDTSCGANASSSH